MGSGKQPVFGLGEKQQGDDAKGQLEKKKDPTWRSFLFQPFHFGLSAKFFPLIAAILAPLSTLLDIPALSVSRTIPDPFETDSPI